MTIDYKAHWKTLANSKRAQSHHMVQYCIMKAMYAKGDNKTEILHALIARAFSPKRNGTYPGLLAAIDNAWLKGRFTTRKLFDTVELSEEELTEYTRLLDSISTKELVSKNYYTYVFVRQDIAPEYQLVQAAHATCVLGSKIAGKFDPANLYFVVSGVKDLEQLKERMEYLGHRGHAFVEFVEPDIGNEITAIATMPIRGDMRKDFKKFKLLTF